MRNVLQILLSGCLCGLCALSMAQATALEGMDSVPNERIAAVDSLEEAEQVADYYGITLRSYAYGVAMYDTSVVANSMFSSQSNQDMPTLYPNYLYTTCEEEVEQTTDTVGQYDEQYFHDEIYTPSAWEHATGEGVKVAIIDTGIDTDHPALSDAILVDECYNSYTNGYGLSDVEDDIGHGTHVAGIVAATQTDSVCGVAPQADLLIIKANITKTRDYDSYSLIRAINYAVAQKADIINMSLGARHAAGPAVFDEQIIKDAVAAGVTVVCAGGNFEENHAAYPAAYADTIAVSAMKEGYIFDENYSNYGPEMDVAAPGTQIYSTYLNGGYEMLDGTSMACPIVTGVAALILSEHPDYTPAQVKDVLRDTAMEVGAVGVDDYYGAGAVNAYGAVLDKDTLCEVNYSNGAQQTTSYLASGQPLIPPTAPTGEQAFLGWTTTPYSGVPWDFTQEVTENITLYADWDYPTGIHILPSGAETVVVLVRDTAQSQTLTEQQNLILVTYQAGRMQGYGIECADAARVVAPCQGEVDTAKLFTVNGAGQWTPYCAANQYTLE